MPNTTSATKALRQSARRHSKNLLRKEVYKEAIRTIKKLVTDNKKEEAAGRLAGVYRALDKAAKTNVIKKNKASRLKSRITKLTRQTS